MSGYTPEDIVKYSLTQDGARVEIILPKNVS